MNSEATIHRSDLKLSPQETMSEEARDSCVPGYDKAMMKTYLIMSSNRNAAMKSPAEEIGMGNVSVYV